MKRAFHLMAATILTFSALGGCGRSPAVTFYRLTPVAQSETIALVASTPSIAITSVTLPDLVDRPQLVVTENGAKVAILETQRWAEPLKSAVPRLLAENLSRLIGTDRVAAYPQQAANDAEYRVSVDIQRLETSGAAVMVDALWTVRRGREGKPVNGRSKIVEPAGSQGYDDLVSAYSRAFAALSKEIAAAVRTAQNGE